MTVPDQGQPLLQLREVGVSFGGISALSDINLDFYPSQMCGLIGPNGAGKTTLLDVLSGIRQPRPGISLYAGENITSRSPTWRARHGIRRTFQRQQTFGWLSVEDNVMAALEWHGGGGGLVADMLRLPVRRRRERARRKRVSEVLELCGISSDAATPACALPLGRARITELARAIVDTPQVLLLDEPTSGLEEAEVEQFGQVLHQVRREQGCSTILIEHDVGFVLRNCDRVVAMDLGRVIADDTADNIRNNPVVVSAYFGG